MTYSQPISKAKQRLNDGDNALIRSFKQVMDRYTEYKSAASPSGNPSSMTSGGVATGGGVVTMGQSDLVCDVELAARKTLTEPEFNFFKGVYIDEDIAFIENLHNVLGSTRYGSVKLRVSLKMGAAFKERKIVPLSQYLKSKDMR